MIKSFPNRQDAQPSDVTVMMDITKAVNSNDREPGVDDLASHPQLAHGSRGVHRL